MHQAQRSVVRVFAALVTAVTLACSPPAERDPAVHAEAAWDTRQPLVEQIDHIYLASRDAEPLFLFFRDTLQLPEVWRFQRSGGTESGGLSLGNVVLEFVQWTPADGTPLPTAFSGIAFEPVGETEAAVAELTRRGIAHGRPAANVQRTADGRLTGWVNTGLSAFPSANVFFCDYKDRSAVRAGRQSASATLAARGGGPLGVIVLQEIVIGATDLDAQRLRWRDLLDSPAQESDGVFTFEAGPGIRLVPASSASMQRIVVRVHSLAVARSYLSELGSLGDERDGRLTIAPALTGGLRITLVEQ